MNSPEVPFLDVLSQLLSCCISDWGRFCGRKVADDDYNRDQMRGALIQFCRSQRELFLKMAVLHDFSVHQKQWNKIIEGTFAYNGYVAKLGTEIMQHIQKIPMPDLIVASPNIPLAIDLFSCGKYTRMPRMIKQLALAAKKKSIPLLPLTQVESDDVMTRIENEYKWLFASSTSRQHGATLKCLNGQCILSRAHSFSITLIYDFYSWQLLEADPLFAGSLGYSTDGEIRLAFQTIIKMAMDASNARHVDMFDCVFYTATSFMGLLGLEHLVTQAADFEAAKLQVISYELYSGDERNLATLSTLPLAVIEGATLDIRCFPAFQLEDIRSLTLRFTLGEKGNFCACVVELPGIWNVSWINNFRLDHWLEALARKLEAYQLELLGNPSDVYMCYNSGALGANYVDVLFTPDEYQDLIVALKARDILLQYCNEHNPPKLNMEYREAVSYAWSLIKCPLCRISEDDSKLKLNPWSFNTVCGVLHPVCRPNSSYLHVAATLHCKRYERYACVYSILAHECEISLYGWVIIDDHKYPRGLLVCQEPLDFKNIEKALLNIIRVSPGFFVTHPFDFDTKCIVVEYIECPDLTLVFNIDGHVDSIIQPRRKRQPKSVDEARRIAEEIYTS